MAREGEVREVRSKRAHESTEGRNVRCRSESILALPSPRSDELDDIPLAQSLRPRGLPVGPRSQTSRRGAPTDVMPSETRVNMEIVPFAEVLPQPVEEEVVPETLLLETGASMEAALPAKVPPRPAKKKAVIETLPHPGDEGLPSGEETVFSGSCSGVPRAQLGLEASVFDNFRLATEVFNGMLFPADANMLLSGESGMKPAGALRKDALENFIRQAHYLNGLMERCRDLTLEARTSKLEAELLAAKSKRSAEARDQLAEENARLFQTNEANSVAIKDRDIRIKELEAEKGELLKRDGELQGALDDLRKEIQKRDAEAKSKEDEVEARIQAASSQAVAAFRSSGEFKTEMVKFSFSTYEKGADMIRRKIAARYPELNMDFLSGD